MRRLFSCIVLSRHTTEAGHKRELTVLALMVNPCRCFLLMFEFHKMKTRAIRRACSGGSSSTSDSEMRQGTTTSSIDLSPTTSKPASFLLMMVGRMLCFACVSSPSKPSRCLLIYSRCCCQGRFHLGGFYRPHFRNSRRLCCFSAIHTTFQQPSASRWKIRRNDRVCSLQSLFYDTAQEGQEVKRFHG